MSNEKKQAADIGAAINRIRLSSAAPHLWRAYVSSMQCDRGSDVHEDIIYINTLICTLAKFGDSVLADTHDHIETRYWIPFDKNPDWAIIFGVSQPDDVTSTEEYYRPSEDDSTYIAEGSSWLEDGSEELE